MFKPEPMTKLMVAGHKKDLKKVIDTLHSKKVLHIVEHKRGQMEIGSPLKEGEEASFLLVQIRNLITLLNAPRKPIKKPLKYLNVKEAKKDAGRLLSLVQRRVDEISKVNSAIELKKRQIATLERISPLKEDVKLLGQIRSVAFFMGEVKKSDNLEDEIKKTTTNYELVKDEKSQFIILAVEKKSEQKILELLQKRGFRPEPLEHIRELSGTPKDLLLKLYPDYQKLTKRKEALEASLNTIRSRNVNSLFLQEGFLDRMTEKTEAPLKMAVTPNTFILTGWVPTKNKEDTIRALSTETGNRMAVEELQAGEHEGVPVKLDNPAFAKPFEFFLELYSLPNQHEIDPTFFIFLGFPFFFGMMLGDIGYGIVSLILFLILKKMMPGMKALLNVMLLSAVSTIIFGVIFGEFFGAENIFGYELPRLIQRTHQIQEMLIISVIIGVCHVVIGLLIGFYNELHHHGLLKAITAKFGWIVLLSGAGILLNEIAFKVIQIPYGTIIGGILVALSIVMLLIGEGIRGLVELPGIFGNILSYARLMALGVASAGLAAVINDLAGQMFSSGPIGIFAGVLVLLLGHTINFMLGLIGPFLHSLRLQYVEFFTKFYEGGGIRYVPFGTK